MIAAILFRDRASAAILSGILERHFSDILVLSIPTDAGPASEALQQVHPDILFVETDVEAAWLTTFFSKSGARPDIILVGESAPIWHQIIHIDAMDYISKPFVPESLFWVIKRTRTRLSKSGVPTMQLVERIILTTHEGLIMVRRRDIIRLEADGSYTKMFLVGKEPMLISKNIGQIHQASRTWDFYRIHKSHIVNLDHLVRYVRGSGGEVLLSDNSRIPVSRECRAGLLEALRILPGTGQL